ncbi:MAG: carboxymuconolactone decarboxylase family protein [Myxococcota bacterium]
MSVSIPLPRDAELPEDVRKTLASLPPLHVFRMMANAPTSLRPFLDLAGSILVGSELDPRKREIAVLRVAHVTGSQYEWTQHLRLGKNLGLGDDKIAAIAVDGPVERLDEEGRLLCRVAEEISRNVRLSDEALSQIVDRYGVRQATELILCCSYFNMLSRFLESTRVELEAEDLIAGRTPAEVAREADTGG